MQKIFLVCTAMMLAACSVDADESVVEDEEIDRTSQAVIERPSEMVFESWSDITPLETQDPELYQRNVGLLVDSGVSCLESDRATGQCLSLDEEEATVMLQRRPAIRCQWNCDPHMPSIPWEGYCWTSCCVDIIYEICDTW